MAAATARGPGTFWQAGVEGGGGVGGMGGREGVTRRMMLTVPMMPGRSVMHDERLG